MEGEINSGRLVASELGLKYLLAHLLGHESDPIPCVNVRSQKVMFERLGFKQKSKDCWHLIKDSSIFKDHFGLIDI